MIKTRYALASPLAIGAFLALSAAPAYANQAHAYSFSFGGPGSGAGQLSLASNSGLAVNDETGDVYVADTGNRRVDEFEADGKFIRAFGANVGGLGEGTCTLICSAGSPGPEPGELEAPVFVAVDNSSSASRGDVYVNDGVGVQGQNELQVLHVVNASAGTYTLTFEGQTTSPISFDPQNLDANGVQAALEALSTIGSDNVVVHLRTANGTNDLVIQFVGALTETNVPQLTASASGLTPAGASVEVMTELEGALTVTEVISKFTSAGKLIESWGVKSQLAGVVTAATGTGDVTAGSTKVTGVTVTSGKFRGQQTISGEGIPERARIVENGRVGQEGSFFLTRPATVTKMGIALTARNALSSAAVAVDTAGDLGVLGAGSLLRFDQAGGFLQEVVVQDQEHSSVAFDSSGDLYVANGGQVTKFPPGDAVFDASATGLAVDPSTNDLYVDQVGSSIADVASGCIPSLLSGCAATQVFGAPQLSGAAGLAVNPAGTVYAANTAVGQVAALNISLEVNPTPGSVGEVKATTATLDGEVNPEGSLISECSFEYATATEYGETRSYGGHVPCEQSVAAIGEGTKPVPVHAKISGLRGGTAYHFRLVAKKGATTLAGEDEAFSTSPVPVIAAAEAREVTASGAELQATVNPEGLPVTRCAFEYGTSTEYGLLAKCEPAAAQIGAGSGPMLVSTRLTGLQPDTTYHWRLQARDANGEGYSPDHTFAYDTTGPLLPDGRSYEMVTPAVKNSAAIDNCFACVTVHISRAGSRVIAPSIQCFGATPSCTGDRQSEGEPYEFTRSTAGWLTTPLAPPATQFAASSAWLAGADQGVAVFSMPAGPDGEDEWYARNPAGAFAPFGPVTPPGITGLKSIATSKSLATTDLSHLVWEDEQAFWPFDKTKVALSVYEYVGAHNPDPFLVGVTGARGSSELISTCGTVLGSGLVGPWGALSADGRTVYFTARAKNGECAAGPPVDELYARVDGEREDAHTLAISRPECRGDTECKADEAHPSDANFRGASEDGTKAFFLDSQRLTGQATQGSGNLYLYDSAQPEGERLIDVSAGDTSGLGPGVTGVEGISADGSHVYFIATGVLTATANRQGVSARSGRYNLYVYERDSFHPAGRTSFIATLPASDLGILRQGRANVTPDGHFLVFVSRGDLTPDDVRTDGANQIFRYDAQSELLVRVSIGDRGFNDNGNAGTGSATIAEAEAEAYFNAGPPRGDPTMSDDGSYVFFQSPIALTPHAINDVSTSSGNEGVTKYAQNIYEYHEGRVYLISSGRDLNTGLVQTCIPRPVKSGETLESAVCLLGSDTTGHNVFFTTADRLVPSDTDTQVDIYDARVCEPASGNPCIQPTPPALPLCLGEQCHGIPAPTPSLLAPGTASFNGEGNIPPPPTATRPATKQLTNAQRLAQALKACKKDRAKKKRVACEKGARKKYGGKAKKATRRGK